jgi:dihydroorotate dehydrogenase (NAD+) catalytic subunit
MVYTVARDLDIPIIGMGGIMNGEDAIEFLLAGASAVGVGTATLVNHDASSRIVTQIEKYMVEQNISCIEKIIGKAHN